MPSHGLPCAHICTSPHPHSLGYFDWSIYIEMTRNLIREVFCQNTNWWNKLSFFSSPDAEAFSRFTRLGSSSSQLASFLLILKTEYSHCHFLWEVFQNPPTQLEGAVFHVCFVSFCFALYCVPQGERQGTLYLCLFLQPLNSLQLSFYLECSWYLGCHLLC